METIQLLQIELCGHKKMLELIQAPVGKSPILLKDRLQNPLDLRKIDEFFAIHPEILNKCLPYPIILVTDRNFKSSFIPTYSIDKLPEIFRKLKKNLKTDKENNSLEQAALVSHSVNASSSDPQTMKALKSHSETANILKKKVILLESLKKVNSKLGKV